MRPDDSVAGPADNRPTTMLQSVEDIAALAKRPRTVLEKIGEAPSSTGQPVLFRPMRRPPIPILKVIDDGQQTAESIRIRKTPFLIGRTEGDVTIPLDSEISARHAELSLSQKHGQQIWRLRDLGSTNGTFVRVVNSLLTSGQNLLVGSRRYAFDTGAAADHDAQPGSPVVAQATSQWSAVAADTSPLTDLQ